MGRETEGEGGREVEGACLEAKEKKEGKQDLRDEVAAVRQLGRPANNVVHAVPKVCAP